MELGDSNAQLESDAKTAGSGGSSALLFTEQRGSYNPTECLEQCWSILHNEAKVSDVGQLQNVLEEQGVTEASDLSYCSEDVLRRVASLLKPIPQNKFLHLLLPQTKG